MFVFFYGSMWWWALARLLMLMNCFSCTDELYILQVDAIWFLTLSRTRWVHICCSFPIWCPNLQLNVADQQLVVQNGRTSHPNSFTSPYNNHGWSTVLRGKSIIHPCYHNGRIKKATVDKSLASDWDSQTYSDPSWPQVNPLYPQVGNAHIAN